MKNYKKNVLINKKKLVNPNPTGGMKSHRFSKHQWDESLLGVAM